MVRSGVVDRQKAHAGVERGWAPALDAFVEYGVGFAGLNMVLAHGPARVGRFHDLATPAFDVAIAHAVGFEHFFDSVDRGLQLAAPARRDAQRIFLFFDVFEGFDADVFAHGENQPIPGGKYADSAQRKFFLIEAATKIGHGRQADRIAEAEVAFLFVDEYRRAGTAELGVTPAHANVEFGLARQFYIVEKRQGDDVGDVDALGSCADGEFNGFVHVAVLINFSAGLSRSVYHEAKPQTQLGVSPAKAQRKI